MYDMLAFKSKALYYFINNLQWVKWYLLLNERLI